MNHPKLAVYGRVSSDSQKQEETILRQVENGTHWLAHSEQMVGQGGKFEFLPRFPGGSPQDPRNFFLDDGFNLEEWDNSKAFADLMRRVENREVQAIFVSEPDRLFRSRSRLLRAKTLDLLEAGEVRVFSKQGEHQLGLMLEFTSSMGAQDKRATMAKLHEGKIQRTKEGRPPSGRVALGLKWDRLDKVWSIVEDEARIVRWIVKAGVGRSIPDMPVQLARAILENPDGVSDRLIAQSLNDAGVSIRSFLERSRFRHMLKRNPTGRISEILITNLFRDDKYVGKYSYRLRDVRQVGKTEFKNLARESKTEIIVKVPKVISDVEEWSLAKRLRGQRQRTREHNVVSEYLLKDLLFCSVCGNALAARQGKKVYKRKSDGKKAETICLYYTCRRKPKIRSDRCVAATCHNAAILDPAIWSQVKEVILNPASVRAIAESSCRFESISPIESLERQVREIEQKLKDLAAQRLEVNTGYRLKVYNEAEAKEQKSLIAEEESRANRLRDEIKCQLQQQRKAEENIQRVDLKKIRRRYASRLDDLSFEERRAVVRMVIQRIEITPAKEVKTVFRPIG